VEIYKPSLLSRDLTIRLVTGFVVGPLVLILIFLGGVPFLIGLTIMAGLAASELYFIVRAKSSQPPLHTIAWLLGGLLYVGTALWLFGLIRQSPSGLSWILVLLLTNWGTDSFAYIGGHLFGKHPLAPSISPRKTVEGALTGVGISIFAALTILMVTHSFTGQTLGIVLLTAPASVGGDLLESAFKRHFGVKDSGRLLPGHGGVLDRIDGTLLACLVVGLFLALMG
jgi:phosphatidate cytidylyltransferase